MLSLRVGNEISHAEKQRVLALGKNDWRDLLSDAWQSSDSAKQGLGPGLRSFVSEHLSARLRSWKGESGEHSTAGVFWWLGSPWRATKAQRLLVSEKGFSGD